MLVSLAESILAGGSYLAHQDALREDRAGQVLRAVAKGPAPETGSQLLPRFSPRRCQAVAAKLARTVVEPDPTVGLADGAPVTMDLDSTMTEVSGGLKMEFPGRESS